MAVTKETVELMVRRAITESEARSRIERRNLALEIEKIVAPLSLSLNEQTKDLLSLSDDSKHAVDGVQAINNRFGLMEERVYKGGGNSIIERLARLEQNAANAGHHPILPPVAPQTDRELTLRTMDNRTKIVLGIIALAPTALSALAAWLATR